MSDVTPHDLVVVKLGSSILVDAAGAPDRAFIRDLCMQVVSLKQAGYDVAIVSSGAAACGWERLGFSSRPKDLPSLQACAAAGQALLTETYAEVLQEFGIPCGQVLVTRRDVMDREGYLNARNTLARLLELGAVPVINENDTVSVAEFTFGDNDMLGAIVSTLLGASRYVILSDVEGLYDADPTSNPDACLISRLEGVSPEDMQMAGGSSSLVGTGGMASKLRAARAVLTAGIPCTICLGRRPGVLEDLMGGKQVGTDIVPGPSTPRESGRKLWIGLAGVAQGSVTLDEGAREAVLERGASVLPVGIAGVNGSFEAGDVIDVLGPDGLLVGRGVTHYSSAALERVRGLKLDVIARFSPDGDARPCIHRDELLVF